MAKLDFIRTPYGLGPGNQTAAEWLEKVTLGKPVGAEVKLRRNPKFHRKFWSMLDVAYSNHEWPTIHDERFGDVKTSYDMFRKYVICKAGYYVADLKPDGKIRIEPKSISFAKMDEDEFQRLYSAVLDVILQEFLTNWTEGDMDNAVNTMLSFA